MDLPALTAKLRLKFLKSMGKPLGHFRYDLNKIPYDFTVEVMNTFKGLDLVEKMPGELFKNCIG